MPAVPDEADLAASLRQAYRENPVRFQAQHAGAPVSTHGKVMYIELNWTPALGAVSDAVRDFVVCASEYLYKVELLNR